MMGRQFRGLALGALAHGALAAGALTSGALGLAPARLEAQQPATTTNNGQPLPLSLEEALRRATGASENVAIAKAGEERAHGQLGQAKSALMPQLATTVNWQKQLQNQFASIAKSAGAVDSGAGTQPSFTRIFASEYNFNLGITGSQALYTGGRATANIRAARAGRESAEIGITSATAQAQLDVTEAYYNAVLTDRLLAIADSSLVQAERTLRQVQISRSVGSTAEFELIRARVTRDNQRPNWLQSRTQRDVAYVRLRQLLNLPEDYPISLTDTIAEIAVPLLAQPTAPATSVNVMASEVLRLDQAVQDRVAATLRTGDTAVALRAPVRQALKGVDVATQQLKAARAAYKPSLSAVTNYQQLAYPLNVLPSSLNGFYPNWTVGIGLSYPFFTGGRVRGEVMAAEANLIEAQQRLKLVQEGAALDARTSSARLVEAEAVWQAAAGTADQAQRAYEIAEIRFREGLSSQLELLEIRVQLQQALANRARSARDVQVARKRLELLRNLPLSGGSTTTGSNP